MGRDLRSDRDAGKQLEWKLQAVDPTSSTPICSTHDERERATNRPRTSNRRHSHSPSLYETALRLIATTTPSPPFLSPAHASSSPSLSPTSPTSPRDRQPTVSRNNAPVPVTYMHRAWKTARTAKRKSTATRASTSYGTTSTPGGPACSTSTGSRRACARSTTR